jgi:Family of unknown function (DUF5518)
VYFSGVDMVKLNWKAIVVSFLVTIVIAVIFGIYLPKNVGLIGPIISGLIAGYMVGTSYTNGLVNGAIPAGVAGLIFTTVVVLLSINTISSAAMTLGYTGSTETLIISSIIGAAFVGFALYFVLGIIGSMVGVFIKKRDNN